MLRLIKLGFRRAVLGTARNSIVRRSTSAVLAKHADQSPRIVRALHYGANYIDAKYLAIWYLFGTNDDLQSARSSSLDQALAAETRAELRQRGYPPSVINEIAVGVESNENVERGGGWRQYFR